MNGRRGCWRSSTAEQPCAAGRARGDSREGPVGLIDRTRCRSEMASGRERSFGKGTGKAWQLANHLVELTSQQSQFLKEQHLAFAPWHFSLHRKAINLVPVSLEPFDRCSTEHVESRRRRYSSDPVVELRRFAGVLSARSVEAKREILSSENSAPPRRAITTTS